MFTDPVHVAAQKSVEVRAWHVGRASPCVARCLAELERPDFRLWSPAQHTLDRILACYLRGELQRAGAVQRALPPEGPPLSPDEHLHIADMALGMAAWLVRQRPTILSQRTEIARVAPIAGSPVRARFSVRPHVVLRLDGRLVALDHKIGWRLPCPEELAINPRTTVATMLLRRVYLHEPIWLAQWLPHLGVMSLVLPTEADYLRGRASVVEFAMVLAGLQPAPEQINSFCSSCGRRSVCAARLARLGTESSAPLL